MAEEIIGMGGETQLNESSSRNVDFNPFNIEDGASWTDEDYNPELGSQQNEEANPQGEATQEIKEEPTELPQVTSEELKEELEEAIEEFKFENEISERIYSEIKNGNLENAAAFLYEQAQLSDLSKLDDADKIKMHILYTNPDFTAEDIEDEFNARFNIEKREIDDTLMTDEEIASEKKKWEKEDRRIARELKKASRDAESYLSSLKSNIVLPDINAKVTKPVDKDAVINEYFETLSSESAKERQNYLEAVNKGLNNFNGYDVKYSDGDVEFSSSFSITPEEKQSLNEALKDFTLEDFFGPRYYKDGKYDVDQLASDLYLLNNKDKIIQSMITQAVSNTKGSVVKDIKNIDYSDSPSGKGQPKSDYDRMIDTMFNL